jgi:nucleotide-binding universal stress UspA family protein
VIAQFAVDVGADLIAVGPHGDHGSSSLLGTTADTLVRNAPMPVYVGVRASTGEATTVIAAVTEGALQEEVIRWASEAATRLGGRLTLVHAIEPASYSHMASLVAAHSHGVEAVERLERKTFLEQTAMHWRAAAERCGADRSRTDTVVDEGVASDLLLQSAARENAALIVLGRHEGRPLGFHALGRTVRHVLHGARCGVLVLPPA